MVSIVPVVAATAAVNAATASMNAAAAARRRKMMEDPQYREAMEMKMKLRYEDWVANRNSILSVHYDLCLREAKACIDDSKTLRNGDDRYTENKYFDKDGKLVMSEDGWAGIIDKEITTTLYSPKTGEKVFSKRCYSCPGESIVTFEHYTDDVIDTDKFLEKGAKEAKKKELEAKKEKHRAKRRLARMKVKKFLGITSSR